jgi:iron(III) transport system substrate-binding protein
MARRFSRRNVLKGTGALALSLHATRVLAQAPAASAITPQLIEAAKKEGKIVYYSSIDLAAAERIAKAFEAKYPGVAVRVERNGAERLFQRIGQEYSSRIYAVDVVNTSDAAHVITWKRNGWLEPFVPEDVARHFPAEHKDADGTFASHRITLCPIAYNTNLVKKEEAPKSYADLLDPKWTGKIVKAHPSYSGTILTATYQIAATSAGTISRSLPSSASCRCSRRPIRRRSSRSASAPSWPTAANTSRCSSRRRAIRSRSSIRPKARR